MNSSDTRIQVAQLPLAQRVARLLEVERPRYRRLWAYCRNPMRVVVNSTDATSDRPYRQAQEWGLPQRITGVRQTTRIDDVFPSTEPTDIARKEVVIENDIGWRIEAMVDYLFGKALVIESAAPDPQRRALISELLRQILANSGGILLLQQLALTGAVCGFVDVLVKLEAVRADRVDSQATAACGVADLGQPPPSCNPSGNEPQDGPRPSDADVAGNDDGDVHPPTEPAPRTELRDSGLDAVTSTDTRAASDNDSRRATDVSRLARMVRLEVVEPARALPFVSPTDFREVLAYGQCWEIAKDAPAARDASSGRKLGWFERFRRLANPGATDRDHVVVVELVTPTSWQRYENEKLIASGENSLGRIPLVHVQNSPVPFEYAGASDVEPLLPLQDELNTRLSDRASRITLQSFKMYLGKGIDQFDSLPVAPGRMWTSDNDQADVIEFGGDANCPSEESHISDIREAMDKTSAVTPIAAGAIKGRIGNLTSAAALRVTLQALLAKTEKKRTTYGTAIGQICELALAWLDRAGLFATTPEERRVELNWPSPLPENETERLQQAEAKARLGVPKEVVLRELGY
jgi:hypothetical protein